MTIVRACVKCGAAARQGDNMCAPHREADNRTRAQKSRAHHVRTSHWQRVRQARLQVDGYLCQLQHPGCTVLAASVHLDPSCGGDHRLANLGNTVSACAHCHGVVDAPRAHTSTHAAEGMR